MALKLIGAVGLKVRPEAKNFRDEAERDIRRQMRGADRDGYKYPIKPDVDKQHLRRELNKSRQDLLDSLDNMQKQVDKKKLDLRVNTDRFRQDAERVKDTYAAMFKDMERRKKIFGDSDAFRIDTEEFEDDLRELKHRFNRIVEEMDDSEVDVKPVLDESSLRSTWARLKWLTRDRFATIHVKVNKQSMRLAQNAMKAIYGMSGARKGVDFIKDFGRYLRDIDKHIPALGMIGTLAVSAVGGVTALVGSVAHLANEFVRMGGAALALPGIMGGFAVGIGAMIAVLGDFNKELPQVRRDLGKLQDDMSSNFWKQAKIPLMEAWNKAFPHFSKGIKETSTALGNWTAAFADAFTVHFDMSAFDKMFGNLNKSIDIASEGVGDMVRAMSILGQTGSEYLPRLAKWSNEVAAGFANWLDEAQKSGELNRMIDTGIQKLKEFGVILREAGELTYILGSAAERAGFSGFGEMANGMERFNEKLKSVEGQKVLDDLFQGAARLSDGFKRATGAVGDFVWNSSALLKDLMGIVGDLVGDTFEKMFKAFERPKFQNGLRDFFQGFSDGVNEITARAPEISDLLGSIGSLAGEVAENLGGVIGQLVESFGPEISGAIDDVTPAIDDLGDAIEDLIKAADEVGLDDLVADIISLAGAGIKGVADDLDSLALSLEAVAKFKEGDFEGLDKVKEKMQEDAGKRVEDDNYTILDRLVPGLTKLPNTIGKWLAGLMTPVVHGIQQWGKVLKGDIRGALEMGLDSGIGQWIIEKLTGQKVSGAEVLDALGFNGDFKHDMGVLWSLIADPIAEQVEKAKTWISDKWNGFMDWLRDTFNFEGTFALDDWASGIGDWFMEQVNELIDIFNTAKDWIVEKWNGFWDWLTGLFSGSGDGSSSSGDIAGGASIFDNLGIDEWGDKLGEKLETAKNWILEKWEGFKSWLGGLFGGGEGGGGAFQVAIDFVMNAIDWASDIIGNVVNTAKEWAGRAWDGILNAVDTASTVISSVVNHAKSWIAHKWQGVLTALDNARTTITNVKNKALNYAKGKYQAVLRALDKAKGTIASVKDKALNYARGKYQAVLRALDNAKGTISSVKNKALNYARGKYQGVLKALDRASSVVSAVQRKINSLKGKTVSIVTNMVTKVKKIFSADGNYLPGVENFANGGIRRENHVAQIAPAGAMRVWAEPETGGEAYIPFAKSKRARSEQILATVADKFGMRLERYANGSDPGSGQVVASPGGDTYNINVESVPTDVAEETTSAIMFNLKHMKRGGGLAFA